MAAEFPPHQLPLPGAEKFLALRGFRWFLSLEQRKSPFLRREAGGAHDASILPKRTRGSITASSRSETRLPSVVSNPMITIYAPAVYISC